MNNYFQAPWKAKDIIIILGVIFLLVILAYLGDYFFNLKDLIDSSPYRSFLLLGLFLLQSLIFLAPLLILTEEKYRLKSSHFGLEKISVLKIIGGVLGFYFLYIIINLLIAFFILITNIQIPGYQIQQNMTGLFGTEPTGLYIAAVVMILIAPFVEEIFFRGFLLRAISKYSGVIFGSIISAVLFAVLHFQFSNIIPIFILGLIINGLVIRYKSIWPAIVFHIFNNLAAFSVQIFVLNDVVRIEKLIK